MTSRDKQKLTQSLQASFSWLDVMMPRQPVTRYITEQPHDLVIDAIKTLDNRTSRIVTVNQVPISEKLCYSFRIQYRIVTTQDHTGKRWETSKHVDGFIIPGLDDSTIIEFTPERLTTSLKILVGFFLLMFAALTLDFSPQSKIALLVGLIIMAVILFLGPYFYVTYGPRNTMLEERMQYVLDKLGATKVDDARQSAPKSKR